MFSFNSVYAYIFLISIFILFKGSNPEVGFLSREDYRDVSLKKYPVFSHNRDRIYNLFQKYEAEKARNGDYDSIDQYVKNSLSFQIKF
jgi:hypothetical protein